MCLAEEGIFHKRGQAVIRSSGVSLKAAASCTGALSAQWKGTALSFHAMRFPHCNGERREKLRKLLRKGLGTWRRVRPSRFPVQVYVPGNLEKPADVSRLLKHQAMPNTTTKQNQKKICGN